ncbi:MAG TPA: prolyl oligopeptidase family serine peptidase [Planctomycetota bacterium]|nr:prolyl oligopeptidase family serine peptidase [Planctomycetota bacterium]
MQTLLLWLALAQASWDRDALAKAPATVAAEGFDAEGLKAVYYDGLPWKGKPTRVFAWIGLPTSDAKAPGMVLIHGGGGTAFADWVKLWTGRGYAAIAMDLCGCVPRKAKNGWERQDQGGPPGWGGFDQIDGEEHDQWTWHAVADAILGHSLLRSLPGVDADRIGVTGISWGGYLTCIAAALDSRFKFAAPVYGCGFLGDDSTWADTTFPKMGKEKSEKWLALWDPSRYLKQATMPFLWVNGTNDFAYPLDSYQKSYRLPQTDRTLAIRVRMAHAHGGPGEKPEEIHAFAQAIFREGVPLARISAQGVDGDEAWATVTSKSPIVRAELVFTKDAGKWQKRTWETAPAMIRGTRVSAAVPEGTRVFYLNLIDERSLVVSSEHVERP